MSKYTYLLYHLTPQNSQKHFEKLTNVIKINEMCFYVIQVQKIEKQVKTDQFHKQLSFSVPGVTQNVKTSPWLF